MSTRRRRRQFMDEIGAVDVQAHVTSPNTFKKGPRQRPVDELGSSPSLHQTGRETLLKALEMYGQRLSIDAKDQARNRAQLQLVGALADVASSYGTRWTTLEGRHSNNWFGPGQPTGAEGVAGCGPSMFKEGGLCYIKFKSPEEGAYAFWQGARMGGLTSPMSEGDIDAYVKILIEQKKVPAEKREELSKAIASRADEIARTFNEPLEAKRGVSFQASVAGEGQPGSMTGPAGFLIAMGLGLFLLRRHK